MKRHIHLGLGRFHRAHQALYLQKAGYRISAFSMRSEKEAKAHREAGYRFRVVALGEGAREEEVVDAIDEAYFLGEHRERFQELVSDPEITTLTLTITEKGYNKDPQGTIPLLVEGLRHRQSLHRSPLALISCDNLSGNGEVLRELCTQWPGSQEIDWSLVSFPNTMVDRIVPAGESASEITTEAFHQWVIEDRFVGERPEWEQAGLIFADSVEPFERMKLGLLNSTHSLMAYYAQLKGHEFVHQAVNDPPIRGLLEKVMLEEVGPRLEVPEPLSLEGYAQDLLRRFDNPELPHKLAQIAMDGSRKVPVRFLPHLEYSPTLKLAVSAWFSYMWKGLGEGTYLVSDPAEAELRELMKPSFQETAEAWCEHLSWSLSELELL